MVDVLNKYGFYYIGKCNCDGGRFTKYGKGDYKVYWDKKKGLFRLKKYGHSLIVLTPETEIENILSKHLS